MVTEKLSEFQSYIRGGWFYSGWDKLYTDKIMKFIEQNIQKKRPRVFHMMPKHYTNI